MDKKGSRVEDKEKRKSVKQVYPDAYRQTSQNLCCKGRRRSGQGKDKMSVDWLRYSGGTVYACGPGRHTITKNIDIMTPGQAQFSSVTLHVGNQGEKEGVI